MKGSDKKRIHRCLSVALVGPAVVALLVFGLSLSASAQEQEQRTIELETIEIESEVPRRVAQFFVQRDQLRYQEIDDQPTFLPELLKSVEKDPF